MDVVIVEVAVAAVGLCGYLWILRTDADFNTRFQPISDDEFVARCSPGTSRHVALTVRRIVAAHLAVEYERVHPSMRWVEDLGAD
ncbi:MAG: hypothetical protein U0804_17735 [Gemmataceae bacterium]